MTTKSKNRSAIEAEFDTTGSYGPKEAVELNFDQIVKY